MRGQDAADLQQRGRMDKRSELPVRVYRGKLHRRVLARRQEVQQQHASDVRPDGAMEERHDGRVRRRVHRQRHVRRLHAGVQTMHDEQPAAALRRGGSLAK